MENNSSQSANLNPFQNPPSVDGVISDISLSQDEKTPHKKSDTPKKIFSIVGLYVVMIILFNYELKKMGWYSDLFGFIITNILVLIVTSPTVIIAVALTIIGVEANMNLSIDSSKKDRRYNYDRFNGQNKPIEMKKMNFIPGFSIIIIFLIVIGIFHRFFKPPLQLIIPQHILTECRSQTIDAIKKENNINSTISVQINGKENNYCSVSYSPPGPLSLMNELTFYFNSQGHLCAFKSFSSFSQIGEFFCNFFSL